MLRTYYRKGVFTEGDTLTRYDEARRAVRMFAAQSLPDPGHARRILALALRHGLSAYDAAYAQLALDWRVPLVTYDHEIIQAGLGVHPRDFLSR